MKNILLVITLLVIIGFSGNSVEAASGNIGWSQLLKCENNCSRFVVLKAWSDFAVLDKETGLVWEAAPDTAQGNWISAHYTCMDRLVGLRKGWRLPTVQELNSLLDIVQFEPALPPGHPFSNIQNDLYWSATGSFETAYAWSVCLYDGQTYARLKTDQAKVWCVRGGSGADDQ